MNRVNNTSVLQVDQPQEADLDFASHDTLYVTHGLHPFAARCPPQLAHWAIEKYTKPGEFILDPMVGSGTTMVEARLCGRHCFGLDIDPLARLISKVKSTPLPLETLQSASKMLVKELAADRNNDEANDYPNLPNLDYWFLPEVKQALASLKRCIAKLDGSPDIKDFFYVALSSLIVAKKSIANARDVSHSRHHYFKHVSPPDVAELYRKRLHRMYSMMSEYVEECKKIQGNHISTSVIGTDAKALKLSDNSIDLVFTSPPYCNAIDYPRAHRFSVAWLADILNTTIDAYGELGKQYIGTERGVKRDQDEGSALPQISLINEVVASVETQDKDKAKVVSRYFKDMFKSLKEMGRVLKPQKRLVLVVCPSHLRKIEVPSHKVFIEMGKNIDSQGTFVLECESLVERTIDDGRRLLPYLREAFGERMRNEYVIVLRKLPISQKSML
jgi:tRNA G10  N-methylase Trm11